MNPKLIKAGILAGIPMLLTGCVDNDYDLSDIDTTSEIKINDLVLPVNIDAITLNDIFDVDDESQIKIVNINGQEFYAVTEHGEINSSSIDIPAFSSSKPDIPETNAAFKLQIPDLNVRSGLPASLPTVEYYYDLNNFDPQNIRIEATGIDNAVREILQLESEPTTFKVVFRETALPSYIDLHFDELKLEILKGLKFEDMPSNYAYDPDSGILTLSNIDCPDKTVTITLTATGIDFTKSDTKVVDNAFTYSSYVKLINGKLKTTVNLEEAANNFTPVDMINFNVKTTVDPFMVTHFTGKIEYHLTGDGLNIAPVDLSNIPDFLGQEGTDLKLANPQIYLNLNNPVADFNLFYQTGLQLVAVRGADKTPYSPDNNGLIATEAKNAGPYNFLLSPQLPAEPLPDYAAGLKHIPFTGLSEIISGNGLPDQIEINLVNPQLPFQTAQRFQLGGDPIPGISGTYDFIAPIALKKGSMIIYGDTKDGWNDEDIDKMKITNLGIEADVTSTIPLEATLTAYPLDINGKRIPGVKIYSDKIPANASGTHIAIKMEGTIEHLDGVTFEACLEPGSEDSLSPSQTIRLENIRAKVSGSYATEF